MKSEHAALPQPTGEREDARARQRDVDSRMRGSVWDIGGASTFSIDRTGRNATLWPDWSWHIRQCCREAPMAAYQLTAPVRKLVQA